MKTIEKAISKSYIEDEKQIFDVIISSSNIDQAGDVMNLDGVDLSLFEKTAGVFYNHDSFSMPIAQCLGVYRDGDFLIAKTWFHELTEESKQVKSLVEAGVINCASIGFESVETKARQLTEDEAKNLPSYIRNATIFERWKLLEYSIVNIPMNADAMILRSFDIFKSGRTLSASNEGKIKQAYELLADVLTSVKSEEEKQFIEPINEVIEEEVIEEITEEVIEPIEDIQEPQEKSKKSLKEYLEMKNGN